MTRRGVALGLVLALVAAGPSPPAEPAGYRMRDYRAPTPPTLAGAEVLSTDQAQAIWEAKSAAFIDVLPQPPRPPGLPPDTIWHPRPRHDIPGSIWLPDTGYGELAPAMERYFADNLEQATAGDRQHRLVFYCLMDCWMSWNAARRAIALGYRQVAWYPDGTDGWADSDLPLQERLPVPRPDASE